MTKLFRFMWHGIKSTVIFFGEGVAGLFIMMYYFIIRPIQEAWKDFE